jgi:hypothetical protein
MIFLATLKFNAAYCNCIHAILPLYVEQKHILFGDLYVSYSVAQMLPILFTYGTTSITDSDGFVSAFLYSQKLLLASSYLSIILFACLNVAAYLPLD